MRNSVQKKIEIFEKSASNEIAENVVKFQARNQLIAQASEEACHLEGNLGSADFDFFEQKYNLICFA